MKTLALTVARTPILGRLALMIYRASLASRYMMAPVVNLFKWLVKSKETTNLTYDLEQSNKLYLAALIADVMGLRFEQICGYIQELEEDKELNQHLQNAIKKSDYAFMADHNIYYGRRLGWYAIVRALKPKVVIETGVDKGLGACILAAALKRNKAEGNEGHYYGPDINPKAGYLLSGAYRENGTILYGDSIESLKHLDVPIDIFINDSDHSAEYEAEEYRTIASKLSDRAIVLGDNSHVTNKLLEFSLTMNRNFVFFKETPTQHWYPGGGIGISFKR